MNYRKFFMPIGGGENLEDRIYGALLVAKYFNVHLKILHSMPKPHITSQFPMHIKQELEEFAEKNKEKEILEFNEIISHQIQKAEVTSSKMPIIGEATAHAYIQLGNRSSMVEEESKYSDLVVAASPPNGKPTATFEAAVLHSGKPVIMIPRIMTSFKAESILIAWNGTQEISRAVTLALCFLRSAKKVHLISTKDISNNGESLDKLERYLSFHGIEVTKQLIKTKTFPGEALLETAQEGNFDLIVAGAYSHKGIREMVFGGTTTYLLKHSNIPVFMSH